MVFTDSESVSSSDIRPTLDEVIEQCIRSLEQGALDLHDLTSRFPEFESEIVEFLENWGGMESVAVVMADQEDLQSQLDTVEPDTRVFGDFELLNKVGVGGMGTIYKARQISLDRIVALKMIRGGRHDDGRFQMEAEAAAALSHPDIVTIHEVGVFKGRPFFSMQFIEGCNLREYVNQNSIGSREAARITATIARAVHYAHQRGILHRDLKPANVLMDTEGKPYVTDFGLAKHIERDTELTQSGVILGTPGYMAPEQASGKIKNLTTATDVYGLGALLYALLTGDAPFTGNSSLQVLRQVVEQPPASPRLKNAEVERDLETICLKCLEKSPELRYSSAGQLADDLKRFLNNVPVKARPISQVEKVWRWSRRNPAVSGLSLLVIALMIATTLFASFLAWSEHKSRLLSQENSRRESSLNQDLSQALARATRERATLLMTNGLVQANNQNVGEALLWFSEAASLTSEDPDQVRTNLIRCQSWLREHPMPVGALLLGPKYCDEEGEDRVSFQPNGSAIMYQSDRHIVVWDTLRNQHWHLRESFPELTCAVWSPDGQNVTIGLRNGRVAAVDINTRQNKTIFTVDDEISEIVYTNQNRWLAMTCGQQIKFGDLASGEILTAVIERDRNVRKLITDSQGARLVVINHGKHSSVFSFNGDEPVERFSFNCHYLSMFDQRRPYWPRFVKQDQGLMARLGESKTEIFDPESGETLGTVPTIPPIHSVAIAPDGDSIVVGGFNYGQQFRFSRLRERLAKNEEMAPENEPRHRLLCAENVRFPHDNVVVTSDMAPNGLVATGGWNNQVRLWKTQSLSAMRRSFDVPEKAVPVYVLPHQTQVRRVAFSPDGTLLVTVQIDGLVRLWRIPEVEVNGYDVKAEPGGSLVKLVDDDHWMTSGMPKWTGHMENAVIHRFRDGVFVGGNRGSSISEHGHLLDSATSPDQKQLATIHAGASRSGATFRESGGKGGWLRFWSLPEARLLHKAIPMPSEPRWVTYHPHDHCVAVCTALMEIVIVDTKTFEIREIWPTWQNAKQSLGRRYVFPQNAINEQIAFSRNGQTIVGRSSRKPGVYLWDFESGKIHLPWNHNKGWPIGGFSFSPDGQTIAIAAGRNPVVQVYDLNTHQFVSDDLQHASEVHSARFSPDGRLLVTGCRDGHARVFDWKTGELLIKEMTHDGDVLDAAYTPDSKYIITLGGDHQLRVWHSNDGNLALRPLPVPAGSSQMLISPDSRYVITGGGHVRVCDLSELHVDPELNLQTARQISELLANKTIVDGAVVTLSVTEWLERWRQFKQANTSWNIDVGLE